jgi:hypothetical protein
VNVGVAAPVILAVHVHGNAPVGVIEGLGIDEPRVRYHHWVWQSQTNQLVLDSW